jgi:hypothetical protein
VVEEIQKRDKSKWGPVLVEKRPTRSQKDGRTILEIAQDRKRRTNLEIPQGITKTHNSFSALLVEEVVEVASKVGIKLGDDQVGCSNSAKEVVLLDRDRCKVFKDSCVSCHDANVDGCLSVEGPGGEGDDALHTRATQIIRQQEGEESEGRGQWTLVAHKRKTRQKKLMKGIFWNIRGLNKPGRKLSLEQTIRDNHLDFIGVQKTKKNEFQGSFLRNLSGTSSFEWYFLPARGSAGGY